MNLQELPTEPPLLPLVVAELCERTPARGSSSSSSTNAETRSRHQQRKLLLLFLLLATILVAIVVGVTVPLTTRGDSSSEPLTATTSLLFRCFESNDELRRAVDDYLNSSDPSTRQAVIEKYGPIPDWCTGQVTSFMRLFSSLRNPKAARFNEDIGLWNTENVISMRETFHSAELFNQDLSKWQVQKVQDFAGMYEGASSFSQNLCAWRTSMMETAETSNMFVRTACSMKYPSLGLCALCQIETDPVVDSTATTQPETCNGTIRYQGCADQVTIETFEANCDLSGASTTFTPCEEDITPYCHVCDSGRLSVQLCSSSANRDLACQLDCNKTRSETNLIGFDEGANGFGSSSMFCGIESATSMSSWKQCTDGDVCRSCDNVHLLCVSDGVTCDTIA